MRRNCRARSSWVSLPKFDGSDVIELFCQSHCTTDYPNEPAATASLPGIAEYYGLGAVDSTAAGEAALLGNADICEGNYTPRHVD